MVESSNQESLNQNKFALTDQNNKEIESITTKNLSIIKIENTKFDLNCVIKIQTNSNIMEYVGAGGPREMEKVKKIFKNGFIKQEEASGYLMFNNNKEYVGMFVFEKLEDKPQEVEIMFYLLEDKQGKGYANEACKGFFKLAAEEGIFINGQKLDKFFATAHPENIGSNKVLGNKLGMKKHDEIIYTKKGDKTVPRYFYNITVQQIKENIEKELKKESGKELGKELDKNSITNQEASKLSEENQKEI
jgi:RimJ/RimL family protein N-acetyltransferase